MVIWPGLVTTRCDSIRRSFSASNRRMPHATPEAPLMPTTSRFLPPFSAVFAMVPGLQPVEHRRKGRVTEGPVGVLIPIPSNEEVRYGTARACSGTFIQAQKTRTNDGVEMGH